MSFPTSGFPSSSVSYSPTRFCFASCFRNDGFVSVARVPWPQSPWSILGFQIFCAISNFCALWNIPLSFLYRQYWGLLQCFLSLYSFLCATNECLFSSSPSVMPGYACQHEPGTPNTTSQNVFTSLGSATCGWNMQTSVYSAYSLPFHHKL